jgi:hypothetical protein
MPGRLADAFVAEQERDVVVPRHEAVDEELDRADAPLRRQANERAAHRFEVAATRGLQLPESLEVRVGLH